MRKLLMLTAVALTGFGLGCGHESPPAEKTGPAIAVETLKIDLQRTPDIQEVVGTVRPKLSAAVSAKVMAAIQEIPVKAGDTVAAGQLLAKLDDRDQRAEFDRASADFERYTTLLEKQAVTRAEFDAVQSRYRVAEAALSYVSITAPFAGIVAEKNVDVGDLTTPGRALFSIEQPGEFRLEAQVPERFSGWLATGKSVHVLIDATGEKCVGVISEIVPAADPATRSILAKIDLQCREPLKSGMFGRAQLLTGERPALFVPKSAVHERGQLTYVFVASEGRAQMRLVKTGKEYLDAVEVVSGLQPGESVIVRADGELTDGQKIEAR